MLLICFFSFIHARMKKINHNCNAQYSNIEKYQQDSTFNYMISCKSKNAQYIDLKSYENINSISITNESNVFITCENETSKSSNVKIIVNGNPNITFKSHCYFNTIEILGSPIFNLYPYSDISVRNVVLRNKTYSYPFNSHYYINSNKISLDNADSITNYYYNNCTKLYISITDDEVSYFCDVSTLNMIFQKSIYFFNVSASPEKIEELFDKVLPSLDFSDITDIIFTDFFNLDSIMPTIETLKILVKNIYINMKWNKIYNKMICAWEVDKFYPQFQYLKDKFDYLVDKKNWRKVCLHNSAFLYLNEEKDVDIIIIPTIASWIIIVSIVLFFIVLFILLVVLAYTKYRKENKKKSRVDNEHSDDSLSSAHFVKQD